jgi:hypothetical protein
MRCPSQPQRRCRPSLERLEDRTLLTLLLALTGDGHMLTFDSAAPGALIRNVAITGLRTGDQLHTFALDGHGTLYGVSGTSRFTTQFDRLYTVDPVTGVATTGPSLLPIFLFSDSGMLGFSCDPQTGDFRAIDADGGHNLEMDPASGTVTERGDSPVFVPGDPNANSLLQLSAVAYAPAATGATNAPLYGVSRVGRPALVRIGGPTGDPTVDSGATSTIALTAATMDAFTIAGAGTSGFAASTNAGTRSNTSTLWAVNLSSGTQAQLGTVASTAPVIALAPLPAAAGHRGTVSGNVFIDTNDDGQRQPGEAGVAGATVFVDLNRNGRLDPAEAPYSAVTDRQGHYHIDHVPAGTYPVLEMGAGTTITAPSSNDQDFGFSVAANSGMAAIGDPLALRSYPNDGGNPSQLGRAYVYSSQLGTFAEELPAPAPTNVNLLFPNHDAFGFSVAVDGGEVAVGSPYRWVDAPTPDGSTQPVPGAGFVYDGLGGPVRTHTLLSLDHFFLHNGALGFSVDSSFDFSGGATYLDPSSGLVRTSAVVVDDNNGNTVADNLTGPFESVAHGASTVVAGDPSDNAVAIDPGTTTATLLHDPNGGDSSFGTSVALWETVPLSQKFHAFVGAPAQPLGGPAQAGAVYEFELSGLSATPPTPPTLVATLMDPGNAANDHFGFSMALVGADRLLVGAPGDSTFGADPGAAYLFDLTTGALLQTFYGPQPHAGAQFGFAVAADGQRILVGAPSTGNDSDPGAAYVVPLAPEVTIGSRAATADFAHPARPVGRTIQAVEGRPTGTQVLATINPSLLDIARGSGVQFFALVDWGDNQTSRETVRLVPSGLQVLGNHTYADGGTYPITMGIQVPGLLPALIVSGTAVVADPPLALGFPVHAPALAEGQPVNQVLVASFLDSDAGQDPGHYSATVSWGDGETSSTAAGTVTIQAADTIRHNGFLVLASKPDPYAEEGPTLVTVAVADVGGASATRQERLTVADAPLTLTLAVPALMEGQPLDPPVLVATFTDADPGGQTSDYSASVRWGDGQVSTTAAGTVSIMEQPGIFQVLARKANPYRSAASNLPFTVSVRDQTASAHATARVTVADAPLRLTLVEPTAVEGQSLGQVLVGTFTDDNHGAAAGDFTATVEWGDGDTSTNAAGLVAIQADPQQHDVFDIHARKPHLYAEEAPGVPFVVTVTDHGGASDQQATIIAVADAPLTLTGVSFTASVGASLTNVIATFSDLDRQGAAADYTASIDWGDAPASGPPDVTAGTVRRLRNGTFTALAQGNHAYSAAGTYTITVTVQDNGSPFTVVSTAQVG